MGKTTEAHAPRPLPNPLNCCGNMTDHRYTTLRLHIARSGRWLAVAMLLACTPAAWGQTGQVRPLPAVSPEPQGSSDPACLSRSLHLVAQRAAVHVERGVDLARRGAIYAAQEEFVRSLQLIGHARDAEVSQPHYHRSIVSGLKALDEANDFLAKDPLTLDQGYAGLIVAHHTPIYKGRNVDRLSPPVAVQHYCGYAYDQILAGCSGVPIAARALYGLGRIEVAMTREAENTNNISGPKAMVYFETAMRIDPRHYEAANELGVLLARYGQYDRAVAILRQSLQARPTAEAFYNLSVVCAKQGDDRQAAWAREQAKSLDGDNSNTPAGGQQAPIDVNWVDLATFEQRAPKEPSPISVRKDEKSSEMSLAPQSPSRPSASQTSQAEPSSRRRMLPQLFGGDGIFAAMFGNEDTHPQ